MFRGDGSTDEEPREEADEGRFIPSPLDLSIRVAHGGSDDTVVRELSKIDEQARELENTQRGNYYITVFDDSEVGDIARYGPDQEPDEEGTVMFADFTLEEQRFAAMDSAHEHDFEFNEAISFIVDCEDQEAVDYFWKRMTVDGGEEGQCGWLTDRYGVSWQIVPTILTELLQDEDTAKASRVTEAMLRMQKLDIAALEAASVG